MPSSTDPRWQALLSSVLTPGQVRSLVDEHVGAAAAQALPSGNGPGLLVHRAVPLLLDGLGPRGLLDAARAAAPQRTAELDLAGATLLSLPERLGRVVPRMPTAHLFLGRSDDVDKIVAMLRPGARVALTGPTGSGRRALAAAVAREAMDVLPVVWWLDAACEATLDSGLRELARTLGLCGQGDHPREALRTALAAWMAAVPDWLVVVADPAEPARLSRWFPENSGCIIITAEDSPGSGWEQHPVGPLPPAAAKQVLRRLTGDTDGKAAAALARRLGHHAGALRIVAGANTHGLAAVLDALGRPAAVDMAEAWTTACRHARVCLSQEAGALADLLSALAPAPLPLDILDAKVDPDAVPAGVDMLMKSAWARRDAARELVRRGLAEWRGATPGASLLWRGPHTEATDALDASAMLLQALAADGAIDDALLDQLLPHIARAADHDELDTQTRRWLSTWVGRRLDQLGEPTAAVAWLQRALATLDGDDPPSLLASMLNDLALAWRHGGQPEQARSALLAALDADRDGGTPLALATTQMNLANVHMDLGELHAASKGYTEVVKLRTLHLGPRHPETAHAVLAVASLLADLGDLEGARDRFWLVRSAYAEARGINRNHLVQALLVQARCEARIGELRIAVDLGHRAVRLMTELHGTSHPTTVAARSELVAWDARLAPT